MNWLRRFFAILISRRVAELEWDLAVARDQIAQQEVAISILHAKLAALSDPQESASWG